MSLMKPENFTDLHRILGTNIDGKRKVPYALTQIKGVGRRFAHVICHKANVDPHKRMGELTNEEIDVITDVIAKPLEYKIPLWMLNRQKDIKDGKHIQAVSNQLDTKFREDIERMKKIKLHRGIRHHWSLRVRGQHTCTTGRRGRTVGVSKKK